MQSSRILIACAALFLGAAAPVKPPPGFPVVLRAQPGTEMDRAARTLVAGDLAAARQRSDNPLVLIATAPLGGERPALFVQLQSEQECGSAGCSTVIYQWQHGNWRRVLDGVAGRITVARKRTRGMADLVTDEDHFVWSGTGYRSIHPVPNIDLRRPLVR